MSDQAKGQCNCGVVSFGIADELTDVYMCHCSMCRKSTGSGGIAIVVVENERFSWLSGEEQVRTWAKPGHDWETSFCIHCGSPLPGKNDEKTTYVPVSLLTSGDERLTVKHHIWVGSKAGWERIGDDGVQHETSFGA